MYMYMYVCITHVIIAIQGMISVVHSSNILCVMLFGLVRGDSKLSPLSHHQETKIMLHNQSSILVRYADVRSWLLFSFLLFIFSTAFFKCAFGFSTTPSIPSTQDRERVLVEKPNNGKVSFGPSFGNSDEGSRALEIRFNEQARHWTDALPIGNGRLGAMVWGGVPNEIINLNEDTLWSGSPGNYTNPEAPKALSEVRKLVSVGQYAEATKEAVRLSGKQSAIYQLVGDIKIVFDKSHATFNEDTYQRVLDLDTATVKVKYSVDEVEFTREFFSSNPDQVIAVKISANKLGSLNFTVFLDSKLDHISNAMGKNQIIMEGLCPGNPEGIQFSAVLDVQIGGVSSALHNLDDNKLRVEGCDWAIIYLVASSSFDGPFTKPSDSKRDPKLEALSTLSSLKKFSYAELYSRHVDDYQSLFHRVSLQLSKSTSNSSGDEIEEKIISSADRVKSFKTNEDPSLVVLLFQYGRYLLISSSRPGTQVANLQGIWNKDVEPPWDGAQHLNINLQMNYWLSLSCNLRECEEPLFDYISSLSVNGAKTAKVNYEASGWVAHQVSDLWAKTSPDRGEAVWALWPMGGAWLCTQLWEHYTYTMDKDFLRNKAYPLLESCSSFLLDWLIPGQGGFLETNPSTSPEHMFIAPDGKSASVSNSSTMDMAIIKEVFSSILSAAEVLGKSGDNMIGRVRKAQELLYATKIAADGTIMEWAQNFKDPEPHHRHVSHLFGLFPGHTITLEETPDLCKAAEKTLHKRGEEGPGWSTAWKTALWARLHDSENAYRMVKHLFDLVDPEKESNYEGGLYSNLFTAHPPFQIDANFGFSAAIAEILVQSTMEDLYLLPALPRDKWVNGLVSGLKARGGLTVSISWREGDLHQVSLWTKEQNASSIRLHYRGNTVTTTKLLSSRAYTFDKQLKCLNSYAV